MKINFFMAVGWSAVLLTGCKIGDDDSPVRDFYAFEEKVEISPVKKEYTEGDIFFMDVSIPNKQLTDQTTGETVKVGNARFILELNALDPFVETPDLEKFKLIPQTGVISGDEDFEEDGAAVISFGCPASEYTMRTGIQFLEKGGYLIYLNQDSPFFQIAFTESDDCSLIQPNTIPPADADIATVHLTFEVDDANKDKFEEYAAMFPDTKADLAAIRTALDKREAFFVWVK